MANGAKRAGGKALDRQMRKAMDANLRELELMHKRVGRRGWLLSCAKGCVVYLSEGAVLGSSRYSARVVSRVTDSLHDRIELALYPCYGKDAPSCFL